MLYFKLSKLSGNKLTIPTIYSYPKKDKLRDQEVTIVIEIPKGKTVEINNQVITLEKMYVDENDDFFGNEQEGYIDSDGEYSHGY